MPDGWSADPDTDYYHHSYIDWLNLGNDPREVGRYGEVWSVIEANHTLIATTKAENEAVLNNVLQNIRTSGAPAT